jgi:hypothetical protein
METASIMRLVRELGEIFKIHLTDYRSVLSCGPMR